MKIFFKSQIKAKYKKIAGLLFVCLLFVCLFVCSD